MSKQLKNISKMMSLVLRHQPEFIQAELDKNGWLPINESIEGINKKGIELNEELLIELVRDNDKQRFIISEDGLNIRANQGHSVSVDLEMEAVHPPEYLYHGTVDKFMESIRKKGLMKMSRQHVHLSKDKETALNVGSRRGSPVILTVRAGEMHRNDYKFYQSENGVWLTDNVNSKYIAFK
ncbi:MAG: RNA 2'-phosphotransferase [Flavobacteriales bacterium]|nr:RNA 2'-phosphotransferase [Flavobacteriales bacterium]